MHSLSSQLKKEFFFLINSKAFLCGVLITPLLVGYSFLQAIDLFSEASRSAIQFKDLAQGMNPFEGIFVPTWGSLYLISSFVFPFIAIRAISEEKQSGSLKVSIQLSNPTGFVLTKFVAMLLAWVLVALPALAVIPIWHGLGGHTSWPEVSNLFLGHSLYAVVVISFAFLASSAADSTSTAAIFVLAFTMAAWILDFNLTGTGLLRFLSPLSLTNSLRNFERGLFSSVEVTRTTSLCLVFLAWSFLAIQFGWTLKKKVSRGFALALAVVILYFLAGQAHFFKDMREDRSNSFAPEEETALSQMTDPLSITVFMTSDDSRYRDFERKVLWKLARLVPHLSIELAPTGKLAIFGGGSDSKYGQIVFRYRGKTETTLSNSPEEILPLLFRLEGREVKKTPGAMYPGYPLVAESGHWDLIFYLFFPVLYLASWGYFRSVRFELFRRKTMKLKLSTAVALAAFLALAAQAVPTNTNSLVPLNDFSAEKAGGEPTSFSAPVGYWSVGMDEGKKVLIVDGSKWEEGKASASVAEKAKAIYGERYAQFLDGVKAYAYFPFAVANYVDTFSDGEISVFFKPIAGRIDQAGGIIFNVKPNGDYLILRANALEQNLVLFKYEKGKRSRVKWISEVPVPTKKWQELKLVVKGKDVVGYLDGKEYLKHSLPEVVSGKIGLWAKADSVTYFRGFTVKAATAPKG